MKRVLYFLVLVSCTPPPPPVPNPNVGPPEAVTFAAALEVDLKTMTKLPSGLYLKDLEVGIGDTAVSRKNVRVEYIGVFPNGQKFDSSKDHGQPLSLRLGFGGTIKGFEEGILGMREGGRRLLVVPPELGYGSQGASRIPRNATLVFEVLLLEVR